MADMGAIAAIVTSLQAASEITKGLVSVRDATLRQSEVIKLQAEIMSAQQGALAAQSTQFSLLQRIRELEAEVTKTKAWNTEKKRYVLTEFAPGNFAYLLKQHAQRTEPMHSICARCYQSERKSILQQEEDHSGAIELRCNECGARIQLGDWHPRMILV